MRFDLGDLVLDDTTRQLLDGTEERRLSSKAFDFLTLLIKERPRIVTKAELHERIWSGVFVSDASIAMVASEVRAALGETARAPRRIRTAHGHGYAFQGDARRLDLDATSASYWLIVGDRVVPLKEGDNIVGREPGVDVWIDSPTVSRKHANVRVSAIGVTVEDLGSKNGTFVADTRLTSRATVVNGDDVRFGSTSTICRQSSAPTAGITD